MNIGKELIATFKNHRAILSQELSKINLYAGQEGLLYYLSNADGQTMSELVEKMNIQHPTLFSMVERMKKSDLIKKEKDVHDKRISKIYLTDRGKSKLEELSKIWKNLEKKLLIDFNENEKKELNKYLKKINNNLNNLKNGNE